MFLKKIGIIYFSFLITNSFALPAIPTHCPPENTIRDMFILSINPSPIARGAFNLSSKISFENIDWEFVITDVLASDENEAKKKTNDALTRLELKSPVPIYNFDPLHNERSESWKCDYTIHFPDIDNTSFPPRAYAIYSQPHSLS